MVNSFNLAQMLAVMYFRRNDFCVGLVIVSRAIPCSHAVLFQGIAVTGGALLSQYISEKVIGYIGGTLFVAFSITTAIGIF